MKNNWKWKGCRMKMNKQEIINLIKEAMTTNLNLHGDRMLEPEEVIFHYLEKSGCLIWSEND